MEGFNVQRASWHYRWMMVSKLLSNDSYLNYMEDDDGMVDFDTLYQILSASNKLPRDFCSYWRVVLLWPSLRMMVSILAYCAALVLIAFHFVPFILGFATIAGVFGVIGGGGALVLFLYTKIRYRHGNDHESQSLFGTMYASYKGKFCPIVTYEEIKDEN